MTRQPSNALAVRQAIVTRQANDALVTRGRGGGVGGGGVGGGGLGGGGGLAWHSTIKEMGLPHCLDV